MSKRMTVVFDDEGDEGLYLYTALKVAAVRSGQHAKDIVAQAVREWLDEELLAGLAESRQEWRREGGREAGEFFAELDATPPG